MDDFGRVNNSQATATRGRGLFLTIGWISAILSLFIYPFIFGVLGVIMGILATKGGSRAGLPVIIASIVFMGIGLLFSGVILNYTRHYIGI